MRLLVTGGAGFIGSNFIHYMLLKHPDCSLSCIDKLTYAGNLANLDSLKGDDRFRFYSGDIAREEDVEEVFSREKPDVVVSFAAESHVDRSIKQPEEFLRTNFMGTWVLLEASLRHGVQRFHQVSTDEVYGELPLDRPDLHFSEESPLRPSSPYSASKAAADLLCLSYNRTYGLGVTVSRASNNYGPFQFPEKLIPLSIIHALSSRKVPVYGDGQNVRDWIHVSDHCSAVDTILRYGKDGEIYNVGARSEERNIDVVRKVLSLLGFGEDMAAFVPDRKGHDRRYAINPGKVEALGWKSEVSFQAGLEETVGWYLANKEWWQAIATGAYRERRKL